MANGNGGLSNNATFSAVVGAVVGALLGALLGYVGRDIQLHDAVTYNNISSYIESLLVQPGYVEPDILEKENPFQQIERIGQEFGEKESDSKALSDSVRSFLTETGEKSNLAQSDNAKLSAMLNGKTQEIKELQANNDSLNEQVGEYKSQTLAHLSTPDTFVSGEMLDTTLTDYLATISSHYYYSEEFLNAFLPENIFFESGTIFYDKAAPEKVNVVNAGLTYDMNGFELFDGSEHFTMGLHDYDSGIMVYNGRSNHSMKIACDKRYSLITFLLGHRDDRDGSTRELVIYYMDNDGAFKEAKKFTLFADMPVESYSVPIYNTRTVKLTVTGYNGGYALADVYLVK